MNNSWFVVFVAVFGCFFGGSVEDSYVNTAPRPKPSFGVWPEVKIYCPWKTLLECQEYEEYVKSSNIIANHPTSPYPGLVYDKFTFNTEPVNLVVQSKMLANGYKEEWVCPDFNSLPAKADQIHFLLVPHTYRPFNGTSDLIVSLTCEYNSFAVGVCSPSNRLIVMHQLDDRNNANAISEFLLTFKHESEHCLGGLPHTPDTSPAHLMNPSQASHRSMRSSNTNLADIARIAYLFGGTDSKLALVKPNDVNTHINTFVNSMSDYWTRSVNRFDVKYAVILVNRPDMSHDLRLRVGFLSDKSPVMILVKTINYSARDGSVSKVFVPFDHHGQPTQLIDACFERHQKNGHLFQSCIFRDTVYGKVLGAAFSELNNNPSYAEFLIGIKDNKHHLLWPVLDDTFPCISWFACFNTISKGVFSNDPYLFIDLQNGSVVLNKESNLRIYDMNDDDLRLVDIMEAAIGPYSTNIGPQLETSLDCTVTSKYGFKGLQVNPFTIVGNKSNSIYKWSKFSRTGFPHVTTFGFSFQLPNTFDLTPLDNPTECPFDEHVCSLTALFGPPFTSSKPNVYQARSFTSLVHKYSNSSDTSNLLVIKLLTPIESEITKHITEHLTKRKQQQQQQSTSFWPWHNNWENEEYKEMTFIVNVTDVGFLANINVTEKSAIFLNFVEIDPRLFKMVYSPKHPFCHEGKAYQNYVGCLYGKNSREATSVEVLFCNIFGRQGLVQHIPKPDLLCSKEPDCEYLCQPGRNYIVNK